MTDSRCDFLKKLRVFDNLVSSEVQSHRSIFLQFLSILSNKLIMSELRQICFQSCQMWIALKYQSDHSKSKQFCDMLQASTVFTFSFHIFNLRLAKPNSRFLVNYIGVMISTGLPERPAILEIDKAEYQQSLKDYPLFNCWCLSATTIDLINTQNSPFSILRNSLDFLLSIIDKYKLNDAVCWKFHSIQLKVKR